MCNRDVISVLVILFLTVQWAGLVGVAAAGDDPGHPRGSVEAEWLSADESELPQAGVDAEWPPADEAEWPPADETELPQAGVEADRVVMEVGLRTDGSAQWTIEYRVRLDDPDVTAGFETARQELEQNRSAFLAEFERDIRSMATSAQEQTGREMVIENVSVDASREQLPQEYGVVTYQFRWYGFAETGETLRTEETLSGLFLDESSVLLVTWPANTALAEVRPEPDERRDRTVVWNGPVEFGQSGPTVVLESESGSFGPDLRWDVGSNDEIVALAGGGLLLTTVGAGVAGIVRYRRDPEPEADEPDDEEAESGESDDEESGDDDEQAASAEAPPAELLSNEERVLALLEERGGRVKQQAVVDEFGWSETKTSDVVGELREADEVEVYRLGRENVLALPEVGIGMTDDESGGDEE